MTFSSIPRIGVCRPNDQVPSETLKLCVGSWAPVDNPAAWRDLWKLSPLCPLDPGVAVPGLKGVLARTVENAWQFLKVWPDEDGWQEEQAMAAFESLCAVRYPRGKGAKASGHYWGENRSVLDYVEARQRIYVPCYSELLLRPEQWALVERIRTAARTQPVRLWDPDSYDVTMHGMSDIAEAIEYRQRPFAHAFLVALAVEGRWNLCGATEAQ